MCASHTSSLVRGAIATVVAALVASRGLVAQGTNASIAGSVETLDRRPVVDATVTVRNPSTGFSARTRTSASGQFLFAQLPLGGPYSISVRRIGFDPATVGGYELSLGVRVRCNLTLVAVAQALTGITVTADPVPDDRTRLGGGTQVDALALGALPAAGRSFMDLVSLSPLAGADLSLGGQRPTSTDVRVDGLQARNMLRGGELGRGPYTISLEAIREFEIVTNVYDVTLGRQGGGAVNAVTRSGTNDRSASIFAYHRDDALTAARDYLDRPRDARRLALYQWGGSAAGPIVRDRIHYVVAFDRQDSSEPLAVADLRSARDELEAQVSADSVARLIDILQRSYGLDSSHRQVGVFTRRSIANTAFGRIDWQLSERHRLTVRNNYSDSRSPQSGVGDQRISLLESRSNSRSRDNQTLVSLRSTLGATVQNELELGVSVADRALTPNTAIPRGFVRVRSALPDGTIGDTRLQFGGNRLAPERSGERQLQLVNGTYWQHGGQRITVGTNSSLTYLETFIPTDEGGLFEFDSLGALENLQASRYTRQVPVGTPPRARQYVLDAAAFAQTEWRPSARTTAAVGLRYDVTSFRTPAIRNRLVERTFGLRTDNAPTAWHNVQPRGQLTWDARGDGRAVVRVGAGRFSAQPHYYLQANDIFFDGTQLRDVTLTGASVPRPDFPAYRSDLRTVPGVVASATAPAYVNFTGAGFETPATTKASASYQRQVTPRLSIGATVSGAWATHEYQYVDRNLRDTAAFRLDNEGDRAVFVPSSTITTRGGTSARQAFVHPEFTHVLELVSNGRSRERTAVLDGSLALPRGASLRASYTYNVTRDNSTFNCCIARTASLFTPVASDPRDLSASRGPSDYDVRHKAIAYGELPTWRGFTLGGRYVGSSGRPFSLVVNGDINGDDYNGNDLAFVFDPDNPSTPPEIAAALRRVLANPRSVARGCIRRDRGRVSRRNCGSAPWSERLDLRLSRRFGIRGGQSAELVADVYNVANLLNPAWGGQFVLPPGISASNPISQQLTLLNVVGFDQATRRYRYTVNENVGVLRKRGDPYQIQLGVRYSF